MPGQTAQRRSVSTPTTSLQWRAEQLPGQTCNIPGALCIPTLASMEGRAIARPNPQRAVFAGGWRRASMEGRAIARPNRHQPEALPVRQTRFNGGPSNCPAKPRPADKADQSNRASMEGRAIARPNALSQMMIFLWAGTLQWRAEQLPGQTRRLRLPGRADHSGFNGGPSNCPAKPGPHGARRAREVPASMEGRAIARPNIVDAPNLNSVHSLQWRAEQLPGQTRAAQWRSPSLWAGFNGGPSNCPAKPSLLAGVDAVITASMEGRAIARPNVGRALPKVLAKLVLQWRAEQLPGQTPSRHLARRDADRASMEGRAIARPNPEPPAPCQRRPHRFNGGPSNCPAKPGSWCLAAGSWTRFNGGPSNCPAKLLTL